MDEKGEVSVTVAQRVNEVIGESAMRRLVERYGGTRLYIPVEIPEDSELGRCLGDALPKVLPKFAGACLYLPAHKMREDILRLAAQGVPLLEVVRRVGCTERYAYMVMGRSERNGRKTPRT
jgi:hypothetical protein